MIRILPYTDDMKQKLFDLTDNCFRQCAKIFEPHGRHSYYNDIVQNFVQFLCMFDDDIMIGTVGLKRLGVNDCELKALYLDEKYHGMGLGSRLARQALELARQGGFEQIYLDCISDSHDAIRLYEKLGFYKTQRYNENIFADVFMKMPLQAPQSL